MDIWFAYCGRERGWGVFSCIYGSKSFDDLLTYINDIVSIFTKLFQGDRLNKSLHFQTLPPGASIDFCEWLTLNNEICPYNRSVRSELEGNHSDHESYYPTLLLLFNLQKRTFTVNHPTWIRKALPLQHIQEFVST